MIACVAPSPSIDRLFEVDRLRPGEIHRPTRFVRVAGGKGLNAARAAAALGAEVRTVALLGGPGGRWIADEFDRIGIPLAVSWHEGETRSCLSVADQESGSLTEFYEQSGAVSPEVWEAFVGMAQDAAMSARWTTVSGSLPPGTPADSYERFTDPDTNVAMDTVELGDARPALVKVNAREASALTGLSVGSTGEVTEAAHVLRERIGGTGHAAAVTAGRDGAILVTPDGSTWRGSLTAAGPYPVGSGDAFLAGLVTALDADDDWAVALAAALGAAAANAEMPGPGLLDADRARARAAQAAVEPALTMKTR